MRKHILELADDQRRGKHDRNDRRRQGHHAGLLLQRFLTKAVVGKQGDPSERRDLFDAAIQAAGSESVRTLYGKAFDRWEASFANGGMHAVQDFRTEGRVIVGLGSENVLETGIRLDYTYGVPILPGSALKGLASHYCESVWGQRDQESPAAENYEFRRDAKNHRLLFGHTEDGGVIAFHDAWIRPESLKSEGLLLDVMTPHHKEWQTGNAAPTDFDDPNPIAFLSVRGVFRVRLSWTGPPDYAQAEEWTNLAMQILREALANWGIGGKTSSGYGRMVPVDSRVPPPPPPPGPQHERGERVKVTRIADKNKKKRFQADDGLVGYMDAGDGPPTNEGETAELWIANRNPTGYTFSLTEPKKKDQRRESKHRKGRR